MNFLISRAKCPTWLPDIDKDLLLPYNLHNYPTDIDKRIK